MTIHTAAAVENCTALLLARILTAAGETAAQADVAAIAVKVFDLADPAQAVTTLAPVVADCVYDALQTDARWTVDAIGYNLAIELPPTALPEGNRRYRVEVKLTFAGGAVAWVLYEIETTAVFSE